MRGRRREVLAISIAELQRIDLERRRLEKVDARGSDSLLCSKSRSVGPRKVRASIPMSLEREKVDFLV